MDNPDIVFISGIIQDVGVWAIFAWLFVNERKAHTITRNAHMRDLRMLSKLPTDYSSEDEISSNDG